MSRLELVLRTKLNLKWPYYKGEETHFYINVHVQQHCEESPFSFCPVWYITHIYLRQYSYFILAVCRVKLTSLPRISSFLGHVRATQCMVVVLCHCIQYHRPNNRVVVCRPVSLQRTLRPLLSRRKNNPARRYPLRCRAPSTKHQGSLAPSAAPPRCRGYSIYSNDVSRTSLQRARSTV